MLLVSGLPVAGLRHMVSLLVVAQVGFLTTKIEAGHVINVRC
jgi:hypothetical protein